MVLDTTFLKSLEGRHLILQPHLDDVPFSLGHSLLGGAVSIDKCEVWTIFGREFFNIRSYPHSEETVEILKQEEAEWFKSQGIKVCRLELEEAGYRGIKIFRKLFQPTIASRLDFDYESLGYDNWEEVFSNISTLANSNFNYIWSPSGIGGHCDHLAVRQAVLKLAPHIKELEGIMFYDELPYTMYSKGVNWDKSDIAGFENVGKVINEPKDFEQARKYESLAAFHSQITDRQALALSTQSEGYTVWLRKVI